MKAISDQVQKLTASSLSLVLISPSQPKSHLVCVIENKGKINQLFLLIAVLCWLQHRESAEARPLILLSVLVC